VLLDARSTFCSVLRAPSRCGGGSNEWERVREERKGYVLVKLRCCRLDENGRGNSRRFPLRVEPEDEGGEESNDEEQRKKASLFEHSLSTLGTDEFECVTATKGEQRATGHDEEGSEETPEGRILSQGRVRKAAKLTTGEEGYGGRRMLSEREQKYDASWEGWDGWRWEEGRKSDVDEREVERRYEVEVKVFAVGGAEGEARERGRRGSAGGMRDVFFFAIFSSPLLPPTLDTTQHPRHAQSMCDPNVLACLNPFHAGWCSSLTTSASPDSIRRTPVVVVDGADLLAMIPAELQQCIGNGAASIGLPTYKSEGVLAGGG
jgi:hypothetical protein